MAVVDLNARPFPPGDYPIVVVGSGPGGLQLSYSLKRLGVPHAVISADPGPGGMFRKWPLFQRLLSWTKPYAADGPGTRRFERSDWNSLIADEKENRSLGARHMDGTYYFPARAEMEANLTDFAVRTGIEVRYNCRWESTRRIDDGSPYRFALQTSDGEYRCRTAIFAVGVAEPWNPPIPGIEHAHHYAQVQSPDRYAGKRVFIIGKRNSGFELASGLLQWARSITLASPSPAKMSVVTKTLIGVRARYVQPFEDNAIGGGCSILDGAIERITKTDNALAVTVRRTADGEMIQVVADDVINATGFLCPLRDLPSLGVATFGANKVPAQTAWWESASVPGIHFAGTITQGAPSLSKYGIPPNSGAVQGARYNARILARRIAETEFGIKLPQPVIEKDQLVPFLLDEASQGPELWHQRGYLSRVVSSSSDGALRDLGVLPLTTFLDADQDGIALTMEMDGTGSVYPMLYVRRGGSIAEYTLPDSDLAEYTTMQHRQAAVSAVGPLAA
jgi:thioredoxin reductase